MQISFILHGVLTRLAGRESVSIRCAPCRVDEAVNTLAAQMPALADELQRCACAIGEALVSPDLRLEADTEIALIPPVSGG